MLGNIAILLLSILSASWARPDTRACGYTACPTSKPGMLNVHIVPHTHDDVGWLKNVDQYFYGSRNSIQRAGVQYILDSVVDELINDPAKRFIWVETAFFWQWWLEQDDALRSQVVNLVNNGQLEFTGGAWSMHDEATTHYQSIVDQFTWGFRKLSDTFGTCARPRVGWQIDPFGHSRESASLMTQMGFDGLFFARLDYQDKNVRIANRTMELIWQSSANLGPSAWLFTHVLYNHYSPPPGFCFDINCRTVDPFIDNPRSPDYNVDQKVTDFLAYAHEQGNVYTTNNIIMLMGEDFQYQSARMWFKNLDKLIKYVNERQVNGSDVNIFYSTPACYVKAVNEASQTWPTKLDDFFPYANAENSYWTGYFTSRSTLKYFERRGNNLLQVAKQLHAMSGAPEDEWTDLSSLREMMGVMQHHDAITGTEKQHVSDNYALKLDWAFIDAHSTVASALNMLMAKSVNSPLLNITRCDLQNITQCSVTEQENSFVVTVYNPWSHNDSLYIRLPVVQATYNVYDEMMGQLEVQLVPIPNTVLNIPGRQSVATHELVFKTTILPPFGFKSYYIQKQPSSADFSSSLVSTRKFVIGNERIQLRLEETTGRVLGVTLNEKIDIPMEQNFLYYEGAEGVIGQASGAYVFRPSPDVEPTLLTLNSSSVISGSLVEEVHQVFNEWISQIIRVYKDEDYVEFEWLVGPIPVDDDIGREVITRYTTNWTTDGIFYTDSNGRETLQRQRNYRPTWDVTIEEPESGNYYPITTSLSIRSNGNVLAILPDRAQGGSSLADGELELMLHRRLLHDDGYGVGEALNETAYGVGLVARGRHIVLVGNGTEVPTTIARQRQLIQSRNVLAPWLVFTPTQLTWQEWNNLYKFEFSGLTPNAVPENVQILTLEPWGTNKVLLRLEHMYEIGDDPVLSQPATVVIEDIFSSIFTVTGVEEMLLGGNHPSTPSRSRFLWHIDSEDNSPSNNIRDYVDKPSGSRVSITLESMEIRTFIVDVIVNSNSISTAVALKSANWVFIPIVTTIYFVINMLHT